MSLLSLVTSEVLFVLPPYTSPSLSSSLISFLPYMVTLEVPSLFLLPLLPILLVTPSPSHPTPEEPKEISLPRFVRSRDTSGVLSLSATEVFSTFEKLLTLLREYPLGGDPARSCPRPSLIGASFFQTLFWLCTTFTLFPIVNWGNLHFKG